ncbi:POZ domain-containing protein [Chaetoceros tenuissimus]|uniref:POZ domain-containing protein n=1 Tax=Chaetoceros tenuissimus TaxID=426638 RepID=A0AAD3D275_9STRA|nr:POZ domain-containing protein [Chaetoceros tenuissimus]
MTSTAQTIKFNVGGTHYEVSKVLLDRFRGSMLQREASRVWNEGADEVFIEGNGHRFQYVLDFMRYRKVTLPSSERNDVFVTEMEYYGLQRFLVANARAAYETIKFNVDGTFREVPISLLERRQDTMYYRKAVEALRAGRNEVIAEGNDWRYIGNKIFNHH